MGDKGEPLADCIRVHERLAAKVEQYDSAIPDLVAVTRELKDNMHDLKVVVEGRATRAEDESRRASDCAKAAHKRLDILGARMWAVILAIVTQFVGLIFAAFKLAKGLGGGG